MRVIVRTSKFKSQFNGCRRFRTYIGFSALAIKKQWICEATTCTLKEKTGAVTSYPR
jgi:hypothetical protein